MLNAQLSKFYDLIDQTRGHVGESAPRITDAIIAKAFPHTVKEAKNEGCDRHLREGVKSAVAKYLRKPKASDRQLKFSGIDTDVLPYVADLGAVSYYVPHGIDGGEYVSVPELCQDLDALEKARGFMRLKGMETLAEAKNLDRLHAYLRQRGKN